MAGVHGQEPRAVAALVRQIQFGGGDERAADLHPGDPLDQVHVWNDLRRDVNVVCQRRPCSVRQALTIG
jgi:hypothetical protein